MSSLDREAVLHQATKAVEGFVSLLRSPGDARGEDYREALHTAVRGVYLVAAMSSNAALAEEGLGRLLANNHPTPFGAAGDTRAINAWLHWLDDAGTSAYSAGRLPPKESRERLTREMPGEPLV